MMSSYLFFLGGHDAEMVEIRRMLQEHNQRFADRGLAWGAALSSYDAELAGLPDGVIPVFIELRPDRPYPQRAVIIDHHNEHAGRDRKTSIEQVAELLDVELDRRQRLISANDKGHIRAMKAMGATADEIDAIRTMDRLAQGVTDREEALAAESIQRHLRIMEDGTAVIRGLTTKTSAIADRLHGRFDAVFIYTPDGQMHYFGKGACVYRLAAMFKNRKETDPSIDFWWGGDLPDHGFFGTDSPIKEDALMELAGDIRP